MKSVYMAYRGLVICLTDGDEGFTACWYPRSLCKVGTKELDAPRCTSYGNCFDTSSRGDVLKLAQSMIDIQYTKHAGELLSSV